MGAWRNRGETMLRTPAELALLRTKRGMPGTTSTRARESAAASDLRATPAVSANVLRAPRVIPAWRNRGETTLRRTAKARGLRANIKIPKKHGSFLRRVDVSNIQ